MTILTTMKEAEDLVYMSYLRAHDSIPKETDAHTRNPEFTRRLLDSIGSPDQDMEIILVTGSKGKGSTSRFLSSLLSHAGHKVGLYTSPHLVQFNERIRIDGKAIPDEDFIRIANQVYPFVMKIEEGVKGGEYQGPVGIALAIALQHFKEKGVRFAVIEAGRGGRYDDCNVLQNRWAVLTSIYLEHVPNLGPRLEDVIWHKVGIVKACTEGVVVNRQTDAASEWLAPLLGKLDAKCMVYGEDFMADGITISQEGTHFHVQTTKGDYAGVQVPLLGTFQAYNAATAIQACELIIPDSMTQELVQNTFRHLQWPGRMEIIDQNPTVILDGVINREAAEYVKEIISILPARKIVTIIGVPADKDYRGVIEVASSFSEFVIMTKPEQSHLIFPEDGETIAKSCNPSSFEVPYLSDAIAKAKEQKDLDLLVILGTQTLIGNAKNLWNHVLMDIGP